MRRTFLALLLLSASPLAIVATDASAQAPTPTPPTPAAAPPLLLQHPTLSRDRIAFDYGGDIWTVSRAGGRAERLVTGEDRLQRPIFSPDGTQIAFTGRYDGNTDVYVVSAGGGEPRRLTWHPGADEAVAWTPDGRQILFRSPRATPRDLDQLWEVPAAGGVPTPLPLPSGEDGSFSPDGKRLAYSPILQWQPAWKRYRGGQTARIAIADLDTSHVTPVPRPNSNDRNPIWVGNTLFFLSDRDDGPTTLYSQDLSTGAITRRIDNSRGFDIKSASAGPDGTVVLDHLDRLELFHPDTGRIERVPVTITADLPQRRPHFETVKPDAIEHARLSATGKRVVLEARGDILSVPADKGDVRNLTQSPGVADRDPAPSPDGRSVAYFSDQSGEYALHIRQADGLGSPRVIALGTPPSFFYDPVWSPDSRRLVFHDKRMQLWLLDLSAPAPKPVVIATDRFDTPDFRLDPAWSADSRWIAYTLQLPNHLHAAFAYALDTGRTLQLTDGLSDVSFPAFDRSGKYLWFTATTSTGLGAGWLDMSSLGRASDGAVYALVLRKDLPSPVAPQSDEDNAADESRPGPRTAPPTHPAHPRRDRTADTLLDATPPTNAADTPPPAAGGPNQPPPPPAPPPAPVSIDPDGLDQRIVALPIPRARFNGLLAGKEGVVYTLTGPAVRTDADLADRDDEPAQTLSRFDLKQRDNKLIAADVEPGSVSLSADASTLLLSRKHQWIVAPADSPLKDGRDDQHTLKLDALAVWVDPPAEWRQMFSEVWRIERDFFYDPHLHGLDLAAAIRTYQPFLPGIAARQDLNALFEEMTGHIAVGHTFIRGGDLPEQPSAKVGLLGADWRVADNHWQLARILRGENWNPSLVAPLSQPGVTVHENEYLFAVNGRPVPVDREIYASFDGLAGHRTVLTVGPTPDGHDTRNITVVPVASETALRLRTWMEDERRTVDRLSNHRLAYVYLPDTAGGGFENFNRYYFAQVGRQGAVIDERFNHGGDIADYIVDQLRRTPQMVGETREGEKQLEPAQAIYGPKVMIINEMSGSGGDALPWLFHKNAVGTLVGERTWGGLVGIDRYPPLIDGGTVTAPRDALYGLHGQFEVENIGIPPDVEVSADPAAWRQGHDPQLERAVQVALDQLNKNPPPTFPAPPYPDKHPILPAPGAP